MFCEACRRGHEGRDDVYGLRDGGHADVAAVADEDVEPDCDGEGVGEGVGFFGAFVAGGALLLELVCLFSVTL